MEAFCSPRWRGKTTCWLELWLAGILLIVNAQAELADGEASRICQTVANAFPKLHYSGRGIDDTIVHRTLRNYFDALDRQHTVFLSSDLEEFRARYEAPPGWIGVRSPLAESLSRGDLTPAREIYARYCQRLAERTGFVPEQAQWDERRLLRCYLSAFTRAYDPHSFYYSKQGKATGLLHDVASARSGSSPVEYQVTSKLANDEKSDAWFGMIKVPVIYNGCADAIADAIESLLTQKLSGLVLDLRGNQGGDVDEAVRTTALFIGAGPVARFKERTGAVQTLSAKGEALTRLPVVVLIDGKTASAAEIIAAALQDYRRAIIVGSASTFGKGTMQGVFPLEQLAFFSEDPGELKMTIRQFYRVTGVSIQGKGVAADVILPPLNNGVERKEGALPYAIAADAVAPVAIRRAIPDSTFSLREALRERAALRRPSNPDAVAEALSILGDWVELSASGAPLMAAQAAR